MPTDPLSNVRKLHSAAALAIQPNENSRGPWKSKAFDEGEWAILAPAYLRRPHRQILGEISIDGLTVKEANANAKAVTEFIIAAVNHVIEQLYPCTFCPNCSHPWAEHTTGCTVFRCPCHLPSPQREPTK